MIAVHTVHFQHTILTALVSVTQTYCEHICNFLRLIYLSFILNIIIRPANLFPEEVSFSTIISRRMKSRFLGERWDQTLFTECPEIRPSATFRYRRGLILTAMHFKAEQRGATVADQNSVGPTASSYQHLPQIGFDLLDRLTTNFK